MVKCSMPRRTKAFEFQVSSIFVDYYMPRANASYVKVYLYGVRLAFAGEALSNSHIAAALDMLESDVIGAWKYWDSVGVVRYREGSLEFLELSIPAEGEKKLAAQKEVPAEAPLSSSLPERKPQYRMEEIATATNRSKNLSGMFMHAQALLKKPLSPSETRTLYSFHDWLGMPYEVILMLLEHCVSIGKTSMRYIEKVALAWSDEGINTVKRAEKYLKDNAERQKLLRKFKRMFRLSDRDFSDAEIGFILSWTGALALPDELIREAYERTLSYTGKLAFPYMNTILTSWHKAGITQVAEIPQDRKGAKKKAPTTRFSDYEQTGSYDYDEMEAAAIRGVRNFKKQEEEE